MNKLISALILILLLFSCVSTDEKDNKETTSEVEVIENPTEVETNEVETNEVETNEVETNEVETNEVETNEVETNEASEPESAIILKMLSYLDNGLNKISEGSISEGIKQLVSVLAVKENIIEPSEEAEEIALWAETKLEKLGAAISIEADTMWMDANMSQITGSTVELSIQPNIILTITLETGKSLISNAPIYFEFVQGAGTLNNYVITNSYGQAGCSIIEFQNPAEENIVRAYLEYRVDSYTYNFNSAVRDFVYVPPAYTAAIVVLEKSVVGISNDPLILDPVYNELKQIDYEFSIYNSVLNEEGFMLAFKGDMNAIRNLGLDTNVSYLIMLLNDCNNMIQMTNFSGDPINAFMSEAKATIRVIRVVDGTVLYQKAVERNHDNGLHGQGNSKAAAAFNVQREIAGDLAMDIRVNLREIKEALLGN